MAQGIEWYRAHHGTVADPKFGLVAGRAKQRRGDVIAMWHLLMEEASASDDRGNPGAPDFETIDFLLGLDEGGAQAIYQALVDKGMVDGATGRLTAWDKRQPKREREDVTASDRKRAQRMRDAAADSESRPGDAGDGVTGSTDDSHTMSHHVTPRTCDVTPREEKRREESSEAKASGASAPPPESAKTGDELTRQQLWRAGKSLLGEQGMAKAQCGTFVGKLVSDYGDEIVVEAVRSAVVQRPADAASYLKATCMRKKGERGDDPPPGYDDMTPRLQAEAARETSKPDPEVAKRLKATRAAAAEVSHASE
jgi:hypothetical protein